MRSQCDIEELMERGAGRAAPEPVVALYREAFERYGTQALWNRAPVPRPTITQALVIARSLRTAGDMSARPLVMRIEDACRAAF